MTQMNEQGNVQQASPVQNQEQPQQTIVKKKRCGRYEMGKANPIGVGILLGAFQVLYALLTGSTNNLMVLIVEALGITNSQGSWIANVEILVVIVTITFVTKICEKFGLAKVFSFGTLLFTTFNLMFVFPFVYKNYAAVLICKALEAIGLGLCLPSAIPMTTFLVQKSKVSLVISVISLLLPFGNMVASLLSGYVGEYLGYQYMYVIGAGLALIDLICQLLFIPYDKFPKNPKAKIDYLGSTILAVGLICIIIGLSSLSGDSFMPVYACIIVVVVGVCVVVFFFYYNAKLSKQPIFNMQVFNQSTVSAVIPLFIGSVVLYCEKYVVPYTYRVIKGIPVSTSGIYIAVTATSAFVFSPLFNFLSGRIISKRVCLFAAICFIVAEVIIGIITLTSASPVGITIFEWFTFGFYLGLLITCQSSNMMACPRQFTQQIGVMNQISQNLGHSFGIVIGLLGMQGIDGGNITKKSNGTITLIGACIGLLIIVATFFMGVYGFERGKKGFSEVQVAKTKTFDENYQHSQDLVETQEFSGEAQQSKGEKLLSMFNMWMQ